MRKTLSILLVLTLMLGLLAACSSEPEVQESASTNTVTESVVEGEVQETTEEEAAEEEPVDLTVQLPLTTNGESYSYFVSYPGIMTKFFDEPFYDYPAWVELEARTGVHIEWYTVSVDAEMESFSLMLASGEYVDIFASAKLTDSLDYYVEENVIWDLKDMIQEYMPNYMNNISIYPEYAESIGSESDAGYWSVLHNYTKNTTYQGGLVIRNDWLEELGMDMPRTMDDYYNVLTAFKNEKGADSALWINSSGILNNDYFSSAYGISTWYNGSGAIQYPIYQIDGEIKYGPGERGYYDYLSTMAKWYSEGLIYQDFMSYTSSNTNAPSEIITNDQCGVFTSQLTNIHQYDEMVEGIDVVAAYTPVLNEGDTIHVDWTLSGISTDGLCISTAVSQEELPLLLKMWDYCSSEEGSLLQNYGIEGETYVVENGQPKLTEVVTNGELPAFSLALNVYTLGDAAIGVVDKTREQSTYSEKQMAAIDVWAENVDGTYNLPELMSLNADESSQFNAKIADILTYVNSFALSVIVGNVTLDDSAWEDYLATLKDLGIDDCIAQYQSAYDRYMEKTA